MNEETARQFQDILDSIDRAKNAGSSVGQANFQALIKMFALVLARQDYLEEIIEFLVKEEKEKKKEQQ